MLFKKNLHFFRRSSSFVDFDLGNVVIIVVESVQRATVVL